MMEAAKLCKCKRDTARTWLEAYREQGDEIRRQAFAAGELTNANQPFFSWDETCEQHYALTHPVSREEHSQ